MSQSPRKCDAPSSACHGERAQPQHGCLWGLLENTRSFRPPIWKSSDTEQGRCGCLRWPMGWSGAVPLAASQTVSLASRASMPSPAALHPKPVTPSLGQRELDFLHLGPKISLTKHNSGCSGHRIRYLSCRKQAAPLFGTLPDRPTPWRRTCGLTLGRRGRTLVALESFEMPALIPPQYPSPCTTVQPEGERSLW